MKVPKNSLSINLTEKQLQDALTRLKETNSEKITIVIDPDVLFGVEISKGFDFEPTSVHCMYGCQDSDVKP